jgi:hypothetical protein
MLLKRGLIISLVLIILSLFVTAAPGGPEYGCCEWSSESSDTGQGVGGIDTSLQGDCTVPTGPGDINGASWDSGQIENPDVYECMIPSECPGGNIAAATDNYCICSASTTLVGEVYKQSDGGDCFVGEVDCSNEVDDDANGLTDCEESVCLTDDYCNPDLDNGGSEDVCRLVGDYMSSLNPNACCGSSASIGGVEEITVPTNMCGLADSGLKCDEDSAKRYCLALGFDDYVANSKVCTPVHTDYMYGSWASQGLIGGCSDNGVSSWVLTMSCNSTITESSANSDYSWFDSTSSYFCMDDYDSTNDKIGGSEWRWWDAAGAGNSYKIHTIIV